jgi:hypothetical protein
MLELTGINEFQLLNSRDLRFNVGLYIIAWIMVNLGLLGSEDFSITFDPIIFTNHARVENNATFSHFVI